MPPPQATGDRPVTPRRPATLAFLAGTAASLAFFAFFPGLPHVIDWGAILVSLTTGALSRWTYRTWHKKRPNPPKP
jgi:hypothetical protein